MIAGRKYLEKKMSRFILSKKRFLYAIDATRSSLKSCGWGLEITQDKDNPCHWFIWNIVDGYWINVIEEVGDAYVNEPCCDVRIDDDLENEFRYLCMRNTGEIIEEGVRNYLESKKAALIRLKEE